MKNQIRTQSESQLLFVSLSNGSKYNMGSLIKQIVTANNRLNIIYNIIITFFPLVNQVK